MPETSTDTDTRLPLGRSYWAIQLEALQRVARAWREGAHRAARPAAGWSR